MNTYIIANLRIKYVRRRDGKGVIDLEIEVQFHLIVPYFDQFISTGHQQTTICTNCHSTYFRTVNITDLQTTVTPFPRHSVP